MQVKAAKSFIAMPDPKYGDRPVQMVRQMAESLEVSPAACARLTFALRCLFERAPLVQTAAFLVAQHAALWLQGLLLTLPPEPREVLIPVATIPATGEQRDPRSA